MCIVNYSTHFSDVSAVARCIVNYSTHFSDVSAVARCNVYSELFNTFFRCFCGGKVSDHIPGFVRDPSITDWIQKEHTVKKKGKTPACGGLGRGKH